MPEKTNKDDSLPIYKDPNAPIEDRVNDLLPRITLEEKVAQLIQGDLDASGWMNLTDPLDNTKTYNETGLIEMMHLKAGAIWGGYLMPWDKFVYGISIGQRYLMDNTTLGIPALVQSEGLHGFTNNGTTWPSPIGLAASFKPALLSKAAVTIAAEAEGLGFSQLFPPVLDLSRELRWGRIEENFGEDPFLTGETGRAYVTGLQGGRRRNSSAQAVVRMAATCKHFAAFGSPQGGLNIAQVSGGERELRTMYLRPFNPACVDSLSIMTAYSSYDGVPAVANYHLLTEILRKEWGYKYWVTSDAGSVDLLITTHGTCGTRECAARQALENGLSGEMGGGTYTYLTLPDQVRAGTVDVMYVDETVRVMLRTKFSLGLFENPYPYEDYLSTLRTPETRALLHTMERETIVLLENRNKTLPLRKNIRSVALIGPQVDRVSFGDYVFHNASLNGISPLAGFTQLLADTPVQINYAQGCELWSNNESGFSAAVAAAEASDASVSVLMVGTWTLDQTLLWTPGTNATTGEHVDVASLALVGAQLRLVQAIKAIQQHADSDAVVQQLYPGELGGLALAEVIFGDGNPSGKLPVSFPRNVGRTPVFYNYLKGARPVDPGAVTDNGTLVFGHQYVLNNPMPLWSFGHGLSYTMFTYTNLQLSKALIGPMEDFNVTVTVRNTGATNGMEVVQVYITDVVSSVVTPNQNLVGFKKIAIPYVGYSPITS
ncbi:glycoside hydrolase superfamily [Amylocystis lapponica]|nr:glycoside hydrolase superfamily [Amylocystis lapponica]